MNRYPKFNQTHKLVLELAEELNSLHADCIMDGLIPEAEINNHLMEIEYILRDSISYEITKIRNLLQTNEK